MLGRNCTVSVLSCTPSESRGEVYSVYKVEMALRLSLKSL
jgi:hypothetical protein